MLMFVKKCRFPPSKADSEEVTIQGREANVARAVEKLNGLMAKMDQGAEEQAKRSFVISMDVDSRHHPRLIGRAGATISAISGDSGCRIDMPKVKCGVAGGLSSSID